MSTRTNLLTATVGLLAIASLLGASSGRAAAPPALPDPVPATSPADEATEPIERIEPIEPDEPDLPDGWVVERQDDPARSVVLDDEGDWVATFTDGASTVALHGDERRFDEDSAHHAVTTTDWVRVLPEPFDGEVDPGWLEEALHDPDPDVLEVLTEYWEGAPDVVDEDGVLVSADSGYGPLQPDGSRPVGSDWHDFQGVEGIYPDEIDPPDPEEYRSLDCSGYVRMVYGVRFELPMTRRPDGGASLPRRSMQQAAEAPGVVPIENRGEQVPADELERLQAGDLVFFDSPSDDDGVIDHVGFYLGVDDAGHHRFVHSRRSTNGPTMGGDDTSVSVVDGDDYYARGFRSSRRL